MFAEELALIIMHLRQGDLHDISDEVLELYLRILENRDPTETSGLVKNEVVRLKLMLEDELEEWRTEKPCSGCEKYGLPNYEGGRYYCGGSQYCIP